MLVQGAKRENSMVKNTGSSPHLYLVRIYSMVQPTYVYKAKQKVSSDLAVFQGGG
jgi:hypothetical protein